MIDALSWYPHDSIMDSPIDTGRAWCCMKCGRDHNKMRGVGFRISMYGGILPNQGVNPTSINMPQQEYRFPYTK